MNPIESFRSPLLACLMLCCLAACATSDTRTSTRTSNSETARIEVFVDDALDAAKNLGSKNILVVFDLDNTLIAMRNDLGSDQWYEWQKEHQANVCDPRVASDRLAVVGAMYFADTTRPTQPNASALLKQIQREGIPVIALTSRGVGFRLQTFRELRRNAFDFRASAIGPETGWPEDFVPDNGVRPVRYEDGVFLTTGQHKGEMLKALITKTGHPMPALILMLDDKQKNLDDILETFNGLDVAVHAWRYSGEDQKVHAFDPDASHALWTQIEPALRTLQDVLTPEHYLLPPDRGRPACLEP